ncbi:ATP-dependent helicase HrpB [Ferrimonas lipolytica]|uniref:ATP-dependent helicase HrpB n=1 Tax=Ferrimonas lipolytica TaxID=2724191 RepID=A0A6H1UHI2_9GAMM|nr:ATP-dependent helicase HrpB [Ferrimonas lipolytica]QIZ77676.1 ATP-dependent helicase HrpB [Ferrimonas lipolytica]
MSRLPIEDLFEPIRTTLSSHNQIILQAPTGAGKSTALPLALSQWNEIDGKILLLEPRRLAARMIARRLASSLGETVGQTIGLRVRGESKVSAHTKLEVITEGVLTRLIQQDPELDGIAMVLFDEVHERHLATDLALALTLEVQSSLRDDLQIMLMSATLEGQPLAQLLPNAALLESQGRSYPVTIEHVSPSNGVPWLGELVTQVQRQLRQRHGNILVFLPGMAEIRRAHEQLQSTVSDDVLLCPLYGQLSGAEQDAAVQPPPKGKRKVVLATNIAESSLTIDGISVVVDSGWQRRASINLRNGLSRLQTARISKANAAQRAGRAGRLMPGHCVRLWSESMQHGLAEADSAEINRADLTSLQLELAAWGSGADELQWLTSPPQPALQQSAQLLQQLALLDDRGQLTGLGRQVHELGADPRMGLMLCKAAELEQAGHGRGLVALAALLAAIVEEGDPLRGRHIGADIGRRIDAAKSGRHGQLAQKWRGQLQGKFAQQAAHHSEAGTLLALAFPDRIALCRDNGLRYQLANGSGASLNEGDALSGHRLLVIATMNEREGRSDGIIHLAAELHSDSLEAIAPHLFVQRRQVEFDRHSGALKAELQTQLGALVLARKRLTDISAADKQQALLHEVRRRGLSCLGFNQRSQNLRLRVALAAKLMSNEAWPDLSDGGLLDNLDDWLSPYLAGMSKFAELAKLDLYTLLLNQVEYSQQQLLTNELPEQLTVPTGSTLTLNYHADGVKLAVRVQEIYGQSDTPRLARGQLPVTLELLSPARRPLQITEDLAGFWQGAWQEVKKEMKGRYPKHLWPDDPANTLPTRKVKKYS